VRKWMGYIEIKMEGGGVDWKERGRNEGVGREWDEWRRDEEWDEKLVYSCQLIEFLPSSVSVNEIIEQNPSDEETMRIFPSGDLAINQYKLIIYESI